MKFRLFLYVIDSYWHEVVTTDCVYIDYRYRQMAVIGFGIQTTELGL